MKYNKPKPTYHLCYRANRRHAKRHIAATSKDLIHLRKIGLGLNKSYHVTIVNGSWETIAIRVEEPIDSEHTDVYWV